MSSSYWQIIKQAKQYGTGNTATQKITDYCVVWESRCYSNGIPQEVPGRLHGTGRAPSYREIAFCLLNNDFLLRRLGFTRAPTEFGQEILSLNDRQGRLF